MSVELLALDTDEVGRRIFLSLLTVKNCNGFIEGSFNSSSYIVSVLSIHFIKGPQVYLRMWMLFYEVHTYEPHSFPLILWNVKIFFLTGEKTVKKGKKDKKGKKSVSNSLYRFLNYYSVVKCSASLDLLCSCFSPVLWGAGHRCQTWEGRGGCERNARKTGNPPSDRRANWPWVSSYDVCSSNKREEDQTYLKINFLIVKQNMACTTAPTADYNYQGKN